MAIWGQQNELSAVGLLALCSQDLSAEVDEKKPKECPKRVLSKQKPKSRAQLWLVCGPPGPALGGLWSM